jgi:HSP20 family protein
MTYVQFKTQPVHKTLSDLVLPMTRENGRIQPKKPLVNIYSSEEGYLIELFTPGMKKENFSISYDKNVLTVTGECKEDAKTGQKIRNEYQTESFKRSFNVDEEVDSERISAEYVNGVLTLNLPRKQPVKTPVKQITIM